MSLRALRHFVVVAEELHMHRAAERLHIAQPALSQQIKTLETQLGTRLFHRTKRRIELTDAGTIFLSHAKRVVFMFEHLKTDFENEFKLEQGTVLIGLPPITGAPIFANLLGAFKQEYPQIELDLYEHGSKKVEISVQEGLIDLGIVCTQPKEKDFESFFLTQDPMNVIIHRDNILSKEKTIPLKKLANESLVLYRDDFNLHDEIIQHCKKIGFQPKIVFETSQRDLMIQTVVANLGVALLPSRLCPTKETNPRVSESVVVRPLVEPEIMHVLYVIWKRGHYLSHAAQLWLDFVRNKARVISNL